jgi:carboxypeptidase family protein/TonB-dependent receptor-like protein
MADASGRFVFRSVPPGTYKLTVEAQGFQSQTQTGIKLDVNQNATVNFSLQVGATSQAIEVSEAAALLSTVDAVTGQVVDRKFINDLPLVSRSVFDLAFLTPGVTEVDNTCQGCTANNFISNGGRNATADILMDGVTTTNFEQNSGILQPTYTPSVDAVQEFSVQQSNFSAEFGFSGATVVNVVTRSGSNNFHGSGYDFLRNQKLDANNWFNNQAGNSIPPLRQNNFGATIGGPIKRDKTFFFFDFDGTRQRSLSTAVGGVPSAAEKAGDFGEVCGYQGGTFDSAGRCSAAGGQLWDPYTGVYSSDAGGPVRSGYIPFNNLATYMSPGSPRLNGTGFQLPAQPGNLIDPVAAKLIQYYPSPNRNVGSAAYDPYNNWFGSGSNKNNNNQFDVKIDHRFSDHDLFSVKYSQQWNDGHGLNCFGNVADPCDFGPGTGTAHLVAINHTHTFSPTVLLTVSYGFTRGAPWSHGITGDYKNLDPSALLGLPKYMDASGVPQLPTIYIYGGYSGAGAGGASIGNQPWSVLREGQETHHLLGSLSWVKGQHDLKFGAEGRMHRINFTQPGVPGGLFIYDFNGTSQQPYSGGGDAMASFLTGVAGPGAWGQYEVPNFVSTQSFQYGGYVQDNWKISKKLTLNIGLRYDVSTPRSERYNRMNTLDPSVVSPIQAPGMGTLHGGEIFMTSNNRNNYATDFHDIQPRFGLAYRMSEKTVIRAGYGIFYSTTRSGAAGVGPVGYQGYDENTPWNTTYQNDGATPWGRLSDPFPVVGVKLPPGSSLGLANDIGFGAAGPIKSIDSTTPYEQTWSFGIQREVPWNILIDANYIGKKGTHLYFGGAGSLNFLGPQIEHYTADQISALNTYVPNPFAGIITDPNSSLSNPTVPASQLQLRFPQFTGFGGDDPPYANSIYHAVQLRVEKRFSHGLQFLVTYAWSKSIDDASSTSGNVTWLGGTTSLQDPNNYRLERGLSTFDIPQVLQFSYAYELPIGRNKLIGGNMPAVLNVIIGGWQTNGIWRFTDGRPVILGLSGGQSLPTYGGQRPNLVAPLKCNTGSDWLNNYFANPDALVVPAPFTLGTAPRTYGGCRQPGQANATLSLFKEFPLSRLREGMRLEYRFEAFNALNHPQFAGPNTTFNGGSFGTITGTAVGPREVQMALKLYW